MASATMEQQQQHPYPPSKAPGETGSSAAAVVAAANLQHNHLFMSYHNRSHHHHHQNLQSDFSNSSSYNQHHYAQATEQHFNQMDTNHHHAQQTGGGENHSREDNQNGVQQQHFFNQYVTASYPNYNHTDTTSLQQQPSAYSAVAGYATSQNYANHGAQHHYQTTFANQQMPFGSGQSVGLSEQQQQQYHDQYHAFSRSYADEPSRVRHEQEGSLYSGSSRKVGHSDDSENETSIYQANASTATANTTPSIDGISFSNKLVTSDSCVDETIGLTTSEASDKRVSSSKKRPKKSHSNNTNHKRKVGQKKQLKKQRRGSTNSAGDEDESNLDKNNHDAPKQKQSNNDVFIGDDHLTSSGYSPASGSVESYGTVANQHQQEHPNKSWHNQLHVHAKLDSSCNNQLQPPPETVSHFTDLDNSNRINSSTTTITNCNNSNYQQTGELSTHQQVPYARQTSYYNSSDQQHNQLQHPQLQSEHIISAGVPGSSQDCLNSLTGEVDNQRQQPTNGLVVSLPTASSSCSSPAATVAAASANSTSGNEYNQLRILEMRKEKSRDAARSRRSKENHEFYELAKLLPLPAAITSQLDFLDKASIIRLTISFLKLRQFSVNGHPPWAPDFTTLGSINPYSAAQAAAVASTGQSSRYLTGGQLDPSDDNKHHHQHDHNLGSKPIENSLTPSSVAFHPPPHLQVDSYHQQQQQLAQLGALQAPDDHSMIEKNFVKANTASLFDIHQGTHILQSLDGFAFAIGRDGRFLYISETVSMYLGLSQVEMTGSSVFDYTHQQDHEELAHQLGIPYSSLSDSSGIHAHYHHNNCATNNSPQAPASVQSQYSAASSETLIEEHVNGGNSQKRIKTTKMTPKCSQGIKQKKSSGAQGQNQIKVERTDDIDAIKRLNNNNNNNNNVIDNNNDIDFLSTRCDRLDQDQLVGTDSLVRQFCIRMKSTLTKRGCQHFKSSGYRVVHVVAHLRSYQSNDHGHLMDPLDDQQLITDSKSNSQQQIQAENGADSTSVPITSNKPLTSTANKQTKRRGPKGSQQQNKTLDSSAGELTDDPMAANGESQTSSKAQVRHKQEDSSGPRDVKRRSRKIIGMVAVAIALPPPSINELRLESDTFVLRLGLNLKITHVEPKITELLHYPMELLAGHSLYSFVHPADLEQVERCHRDLLRKGQMMSGYYRLLARTGGYIWIQTCATLICNNTLNASMLNVAAAAASSSSSSIGQASSAIGSPVMPMNQQPHLLMSSDTTNNSHLAGRHRQQATPSSSFLSPPANNANQKLMVSSSSPSLSGSFTSGEQTVSQQHLDQHQQQQQQQQQPAQEQCIIFVNYMITNVVERREILDVCQSKDFMPIMMPSVSFSGTPSLISADHRNNGNNINNNETFNSPNSTCSSPCLASLKSTSGLTSSGGQISASNIINLSPGSQSGSSTKVSSAGRHSSSQPGGRNCQQTSDRQMHASGKTPRRQSTKVARQHQQQQQQSYLGGNNSLAENGYNSETPSLTGGPLNYSSPYEGVFHQQQTSYLSQHSTDGVNLAVAKHHLNNNNNNNHHQQQPQHHDTLSSANVAAAVAPSSWLNQASQHHSQQQQHNHTSGYNQVSSNGSTTGATTAPYSGHHQHHQQVGSDHYWNMDRSSIYKAATFAAANLAATSYSSVAQQAGALAAYHNHNHHHPAATAAVGGYSHHAHIASGHHQHSTAHHHHALGSLTNPWESVSAAVGGSIAAAAASSINADTSATATSSLMTSAAAVAAAAHHHHHHHPDAAVAAAAVAHPYSHHHHHQHPPWL